METLLRTDPEKYGYQAGLSRLQRFLSKIQYDWSLRDYIGRKVFEGGYVRLQPNIFSSSLTERLFHACCSLDYVEARRAAEHRRKLLSGEVDDTAYNRRMAEPQFRLVQEANVIHVDFLWSLHCFNPRPFRAIEIYRRVWEEADLDLLEDVSTPARFGELGGAAGHGRGPAGASWGWAGHAAGAPYTNASSTLDETARRPVRYSL